METTSTNPGETSERELVITRTFDAPRDLVFKAWREPERQIQWLGPRGFTGKILKSAQGPGDSYRYYMRDPNGGDHWQQGTIREMIEPERLVFTYEWANEHGQATRPQTIVSLTFEDVGGKTRMTLRQGIFPTVEACDDHRNGWNSSLDRLSEYVASAR